MKKDERTNIVGKDEKLNIVGATPITPYGIAEMIICLVAAVLGLLYLYANIIPMEFLIPTYTAAFAAIAVLKFIDIKKSKTKKPSSFILAIVLAVLALAMAVVTVMYFVR